MRLIPIWYRVTASFRRRRLERDLDTEVAFHVAMRQASYVAGGASPAEAGATHNGGSATPRC